MIDIINTIVTPTITRTTLHHLVIVDLITTRGLRTTIGMRGGIPITAKQALSLE